MFFELKDSFVNDLISKYSNKKLWFEDYIDFTHDKKDINHSKEQKEKAKGIIRNYRDKYKNEQDENKELFWYTIYHLADALGYAFQFDRLADFDNSSGYKRKSKILLKAEDGTPIKKVIFDDCIMIDKELAAHELIHMLNPDLNKFVTNPSNEEKEFYLGKEKKEREMLVDLIACYFLLPPKHYEKELKKYNYDFETLAFTQSISVDTAMKWSIFINSFNSHFIKVDAVYKKGSFTKFELIDWYVDPNHSFKPFLNHNGTDILDIFQNKDTIAYKCISSSKVKERGISIHMKNQYYCYVCKENGRILVYGWLYSLWERI